jgi:heme/copper-type cytochrome/quinol oxidase subunit 3
MSASRSEISSTVDVPMVVPIAANVSIGATQRNLWVGARMLAAATAFLFMPFVFAYLYLGSLDSSAMWRPNHLAAPMAWGLAILVPALLSAALVAFARSELVHARTDRARLAALGGLALGLLCGVLQVIELFSLPFGATDGGFASVFVSWSGGYALLVLATMVWLEIVVAGMLRGRRSAADIEVSELDAISFYWSFVAAFGALTFTFLYLL